MDPPYATGKNFGEFNDNLTRKKLSIFLKQVFQLCHSALKDTGSILVHVDFRLVNIIANDLDEIFGEGDRGNKSYFKGFRNEIIWVYGLGGSSPFCYPKKHDNILWYSKSDAWTFNAPKVKATSAKLKNCLKKQPDVFNDIPSLNNMANERTKYPTQKPLKLLDRLILAHSNINDNVMDPFCGSGTTVISALKNNRKAIGFDQNKNAIDIAKKRIKDLQL
jgi:DNA modification methylase